MHFLMMIPFSCDFLLTSLYIYSNIIILVVYYYSSLTYECSETSQLSEFYSETQDFGSLLTVSLSTSDFLLSVLNSQGDPQKLISQSDCYVRSLQHTYVSIGGEGGLGVLPKILSKGCLAPPFQTNYYVMEITWLCFICFGAT